MATCASRIFQGVIAFLLINTVSLSAVTYYIEEGRQSCDKICQKHGYVCTTTNHGFTNTNTLLIFKSKGVKCKTGFTDTDTYTYDTSPAYINAKYGWGGRCIGWQNVPSRFSCLAEPRHPYVQRLCPCIKDCYPHDRVRALNCDKLNPLPKCDLEHCTVFTDSNEENSKLVRSSSSPYLSLPKTRSIIPVTTQDSTSGASRRHYTRKCERQWQTFGDSIYQICKVRTDKWIDAQAACQNIGANLVKIETRAENEFLTRITKTLKMQNSWLGLRRGWDNWFYWSDGSRPTYRNWLPSGPKHFEGREYCVNLKDNGKWSDVFCDAMPRVYNYICEKKKCQSKRIMISSPSSVSPRLVASSYKDSNHSAVYGDLFNTTSIWCPQSNSTIEWLEVDLGAPYFICGVAAVNDVGVTNRTAITWYGVAMSLKVITEDTNGKNVSQEFRSGSSFDKLQVQELHGVARYLRFIPTRWVEWPCMKIAVFRDGKLQPPRMTLSMRNRTVEHISSTTFSCLAYGFPFPSYTWTKDGSNVIPNGVLRDQNTLLQLSQVNISSEGWYTCTATTPLGSVTSSAYLSVHAKPTDLRAKSPINALNGRLTMLSCESFSLPIPNVTWTKEGQVLSEGRYSISNKYDRPNNKLFSQLIIRNVSTDDIGLYKCRFMNYRGSVEAGIELHVGDGCQPALFDFEGGATSLESWGRTGTAFGNQPTFGDNVKAQVPGHSANNQGDYWIGTFENRPGPASAVRSAGNGPQGTLMSPEFKITGPNVSFLIGGGCDRSTEAVKLLIGGRAVLKATGKCLDAMKRVKWNLKQFIGQRARLLLIDFSSGNWGHISFDDFRGDVDLCEGCSEPLGMTNGRIPDFAITASTEWGPAHAAKYGRLYTLRRDGHMGSWSSKGSLLGQWIQADIGTVTHVTKVATQGRHGWSQWVTSYTLGYSSDGSNFQQYTKVLKGNSDRNTIVENFLTSPIRGRYIRIYPKTWYRFISMRMELYGCPPKPSAPKMRTFGLINETTATTGSDVVLYCEAVGYPYLRYVWTTKGSANNIKVLASDQQLTLRNVTANHDGVYTCTASNTAGADKLYVRIRVDVAPILIQRLPSKQVLFRNTVSRLQCEAKAKPKPTAAWYKDGILLTNGGRITMLSTGDANTRSVLEISDTELGDSGGYKCVFKNSQGRVTGSGRVEVHAAPEITSKPKNTTTLFGGDVMLACAAIAVPPATYSWKLNGEYLKEGRNLAEGTLVMRNIGTREEGMYTCEAQNVLNMTSSSAYVTVNTKPFFKTPLLPDKNVVRTQTAVIHCDATGKPAPEMDWSKDGVRLQQTARIRFESSKHVLIIHQLENKDSGLYKCLAHNSVGNATAFTSINVLGEPTIDSDLTRGQVGTNMGAPASLMCFSSNPLPVQYSWSKNGKVLHNTDNIKVYNNILIVHPRRPKDFGVYVCHVSNVAGRANYSITLVQCASENSGCVCGPAVSAARKGHDGAELKLSILIPLILVIIALVAVIIIQAYRHRRPSHHYSYAPGESMRLTDVSQGKENPYSTYEQEMSEMGN